MQRSKRWKRRLEKLDSVSEGHGGFEKEKVKLVDTSSWVHQYTLQRPPRIDKSTAAVLLSRSHPMNKTAPATHICQICKKTKSPHEGTIAELIRPSLVEFIKTRVPEWDDKGFVCFDDRGEFRKNSVKEVLQDTMGDVSA